MSDIPIKNIGNSVEAGNTGKIKEINEEKGSGFESVINDALNKVSQVQNDVDKAVNELAAGGDVTNAVLAIEKADMSFQLMVEVRNKLLDTYKEIMRMNV